MGKEPVAKSVVTHFEHVGQKVRMPQEARTDHLLAGAGLVARAAMAAQVSKGSEVTVAPVAVIRALVKLTRCVLNDAGHIKPERSN